MVNSRENVTMITEEDIEQLIAEWEDVPAWIKTHVTAKCPVHRYEGELILDEENLVFSGRDIKEGEHFEMGIPFDTITDVHIGFNKELESSIDTAFGARGTIPFAVRHHKNDGSQTVYFNSCVDKYVPHININNMRWYEMLDEIIARGEKIRLSNQRKRHLVTAW